MSISNIDALKNLYAKISGNSADTISPKTIHEAIDEITKAYESGGGSSDSPLSVTELTYSVTTSGDVEKYTIDGVENYSVLMVKIANLIAATYHNVIVYIAEKDNSSKCCSLSGVDSTGTNSTPTYIYNTGILYSYYGGTLNLTIPKYFTKTLISDGTTSVESGTFKVMKIYGIK